jgi:NAD(P)-dependent dehydrogenase (short-subunit alcohol dehydrogenase family)
MGSRDLLKDRTLLVTGSTGIAQATAEQAAAEGARVFVVSRTPEHAEALSRRVGGAFLAADLTRAESAERAVEACVDRYGRLDALFNVAGVSGRPWGDGPVHECTDEGWDATLQANARSVFLMCRAAVRRMLRQEPGPDGLRGSILNMASVLAFSPQGRHFATHAYAASKGAILALSRAMAATYAPHKIRINAIAPGLVRTPMSARAQGDPEILALMKSKQPLAEDLLEAADVARAAIFLLGPGARAVTGDTLVVDGGWGVSG